MTTICKVVLIKNDMMKWKIDLTKFDSEFDSWINWKLLIDFTRKNEENKMCRENKKEWYKNQGNQ